MKQKAKQELRDKSIEELKALITEIEKELQSHHLAVQTDKEKNVRAGKNKRIEIAVIKTIITEKQLTA